MAKSRKMKWAGHAARMGRRIMHVVFLLARQKKRDN
jgi:hypothetical protein